MKYDLYSDVSNEKLAAASTKLGKQIAEAAGEVYDNEKHTKLGFDELKRRIEEKMMAAEGEVLEDVIGDNLELKI